VFAAALGVQGFIDSAVPPPPPPGIPTLYRVGNFSSPRLPHAPPADSQRLFVIQQDGVVRVLHHDTIQTRPVPRPPRPIGSAANRGLLSSRSIRSMRRTAASSSFHHPGHAASASSLQRVEAIRTAPTRRRPDTILKVVASRAENHNGGQLQFRAGRDVVGGDGGRWRGWRSEWRQNKHACSASCCGST